MASRSGRPKEFVIFRSQDLKVWEAQPQTVVPSPADEEVQVILPSLAARFFYRISAVLDSGAVHAAALDPFGYGKTFAVELSGLGQISPNEFYGLFHPTHQPLPGISFDPTTAFSGIPMEFPRRRIRCSGACPAVWTLRSRC